MDKTKLGNIATGVASVIKEVTSNSTIQKLVLGTYSDGATRSISDALDDEIYSPKQRGKAIKRNKKRNKKKNRKKFKL